mgnify:FL=1|tara:strand:- start:1073 stop:2440 length:1368 start_codon:yes stop_codon:yes gene_type:complete
MALNPFFLQGSKGEQNLLKDLAKEQIQMHGIEFIYMPRTLVNQKEVMREITSSKFEKSFPLEGYISSYEGFDSGYNLLTKFGVRSTAEMKIVISIERYDQGIAPLLSQARPNEGDLMYFPLRDIIFEIKYVNDIENFYQLRERYTYELTCEPFEFEDEVIDTGVTAIDDDFEDEGYNVTMKLGDKGTRATATATIGNGGIYKIDLISGGAGYTNAPTIVIEPPDSGTQATAVAITSTSGSRLNTSLRVSDIRITNPGAGYTQIPNIQFIPEDGKGIGASAVAGLGTSGVITGITLTNSGAGYFTPPLVTVSNPAAGGEVGVLTARINTTTNRVTHIDILNAGHSYASAPTITVGAANTFGSGTFQYGQIITGESSLTTAFVTKWDTTTNTLFARNLSGNFAVGENINNVGFGTAQYALDSINYDDDDAYNTGDEIETLSTTSILDFTEKNPFGEV